MMQTCPPNETLSAWLDDELSQAESHSVRGHLEGCTACRGQVIGWIETVQKCGTVVSSDHALRARLTTCLDDEALVAYSEGQLSDNEARRAEHHLRECVACVSEVQRLIHLQVEVGEVPIGVATATPPAPEPTVRWVRAAVTGWLGPLGEWLRSAGRLVLQPWPALGAVAAMVLVVLIVARFLPGRGADDVQVRGVEPALQVEVMAETVIARARPSEDEPIVATLVRGTVARPLEQSDEWTRIELFDGRRVWVRSVQLSGVLPRPLREGRGEGGTP